MACPSLSDPCSAAQVEAAEVEGSSAWRPHRTPSRSPGVPHRLGGGDWRRGISGLPRRRSATRRRSQPLLDADAVGEVVQADLIAAARAVHLAVAPEQQPPRRAVVRVSSPGSFASAPFRPVRIVVKFAANGQVVALAVEQFVSKSRSANPMSIVTAFVSEEASMSLSAAGSCLLTTSPVDAPACATR